MSNKARTWRAWTNHYIVKIENVYKKSVKETAIRPKNKKSQSMGLEHSEKIAHPTADFIYPLNKILD